MELFSKTGLKYYLEICIQNKHNLKQNNKFSNKNNNLTDLVHESRVVQ